MIFFGRIKYKLAIFLRILLLVSTFVTSVLLFLLSASRLSNVISIILFLAVFFQFESLYRFLIKTNQKLSLFLDLVKQSDFTSKFSSDSHLHQSFDNLNDSFNAIMQSFQNERLEKEEHLQYLKTIVQHISTGMLAYDEEGNVDLINENAKQLIGIETISNLEELIEKNHKLYKVLLDLPPGKSTLLKQNDQKQISIHTITLKTKKKTIKLAALQNIHPELQKKELESWQNLAKVLRHEIMNSITPIASLNSTFQQILKEDLKKVNDGHLIDQSSLEDLKDGITSIENRTTGLIKFINAYRDYTSIPQPKIRKIQLGAFLENFKRLITAELEKSKVTFSYHIASKALQLEADPDLIEMVLLNLIRNAIEANNEYENLQISIECDINDKGFVFIDVKDNGIGILPEARNNIFIPFFTTKKNGSGIGLSLSSQIMQLHYGSISVFSTPEKETVFRLQF